MSRRVGAAAAASGAHAPPAVEGRDDFPTTHRRLVAWVNEVRALTSPDRVHWCDGSAEEYDRLCAQLVGAGTFVRLSDAKRPDSYWATTDPADTARTEERSFVCSQDAADAGPTNNWRDPAEMRSTLARLFRGAMKGRTMYVVPFCMGPVGSPAALVGVELTDSAYVAVNMRIMTRMGAQALERLGQDGEFVPCVHSMGVPLEAGRRDVPWPCDPSNACIAHFPETREIWSYGSGYGGNALLGKKSLALRIASVVAREEGWLAEHMLILKLIPPDGQARYITGAFPSLCGKTNLAMIEPTVRGWKAETIGDDLCWMRFGADGRLYAVNPEAGFFGVAPGTNAKTSPNAMRTLARGCIFTNTAKTEEGDVWWEGMTPEPPARIIDWLRRDWTPASGTTAAHPNARFTAPAALNPAIAPEWEDPDGVPVSAVFLGGRRASVFPLITEAFSWQHGVFLGSLLASETTAAAAGAVGRVRRDPFAMRPFCGYNIGDYLSHWLAVGRSADPAMLPKIFYVNWFRQGVDGRVLWPGFGDNSRVLAWALERCAGGGDAVETPIGFVPAPGAIGTEGLDLAREAIDELLRVDIAEWRAEVGLIAEHYEWLGGRLPPELRDELQQLERRLEGASASASRPRPLGHAAARPAHDGTGTRSA